MADLAERRSAEEPRPESFVAIFSDAPLDLRAIESSGVAARGDAPEGSTRPGSLQRVVDLAASGTSRSAGRRPGTVAEPIRYRVERFEFLLDPGFQIDESQALADGRASRGSPVEVAVRLLDLVILRNRAVFSTDVRLDVAFISGGAGDTTPLVARTWTFPRIADGDRLSADELALYFGPVQGFLEVAIWVSRSNQENPNLAELIGISLQDQMLSTSAGSVSASVTGADRFVVTAGVSAVGTLIEAVGRVLRKAVNRSIGLYRTTLLVPEGLTAGRRPAEGLRETQDMAFAYDVVVRD